MTTLSTGAISQIYHDSKPRRPVLQVTDIKIVNSVDPNGPRQVKCKLSDGEQWGMGMMPPEMAQKVIAETLKDNGCIKLKNYLVNKLGNTTMCIVIDAEVLSVQEAPIGEPVPWTDRMPALTVLSASGEELARNLMELCANEAGRSSVLAASGHVVLVGLLHAGPDSLTTKHAVQALLTLSGNVAASRQMLVQAGAVAPAVELLRTAPTASNELFMTDALALVCNLTNSSAGIEAVKKEGAIALAVTLLSAVPAVAKYAASVLINLSTHPDTNQLVNLAEIREAGAISPLMALLHGEAAGRAASALSNLSGDADGAAAIVPAGAIVPLVALLHATEAETAAGAAGALRRMAALNEQSRPAILAALAARPPPPPREDDKWAYLANLLACLRPIAMQRLTAAVAGDDEAELQEAIDQAVAVTVAGVIRTGWTVADAELQRARTKLAAMREAAEAARRERRTSLGLDELKTPDEFVCPITYEVMQDPVCASDGNTYERSAIEVVLALPDERRKSPLTREPLQTTLFPNRALKNRIIAHEQDAEAVAEKAAQRILEAERTSVAARKRPLPAGAEDSPDEGASSSSAGGHKRGRRQ